MCFAKHRHFSIISAMNKFARIFAVLLVTFASGAFAAWDGSASATAPATRTIDGKVFYEISTAADLAWFAGQTNGPQNPTVVNAILTNDIVFGGDTSSVSSKAWTPVGLYQMFSYKGTFDGNGKTIYGLYVAADVTFGGLFGWVDTAGVVKNVNVHNSKISGGVSVGGIAAYNIGLLKNCSFSGEISGSYRTGGIAGVSLSRIDSCVNYGSVTSTVAFAGGIVGLDSAGTDFVGVSDCTNYGTVSGDQEMGGIVGKAYANVSGCVNAGKVISNGLYIGGIVGSLHTGSVFNCRNTADVSTNSLYAAGIVGNSSGNIDLCINTGNISAKEFTVGGIAAALNGGNITRSMNYGSVYGDGFYIGGIAGVVTDGGISDCANFGNITATKLQAGGIAGYAINSVIQNSYSAADTVVGKKEDITGADTVVADGGVAGSCSKCSVLNSYYDSSLLPGSVAVGGNTKETFDARGLPSDSIGAEWFVTVLNTPSGKTESSGIWSLGSNGMPVIVQDIDAAAPAIDGKTDILPGVRRTAAIAGDFRINVEGRGISVTGARDGTPCTLFDLRGRSLAVIRVNGGMALLDAPSSGRYYLRIGDTIRGIRVR
jgi:hypothetical protein